MADYYNGGEQQTTSPVQDQGAFIGPTTTIGQQFVAQNQQASPRALGAGVGRAVNPYVYNNNIFNMNWQEIIRRALKYLLEGLAVAFVAYYFLRNRLPWTDILKLAITAAFVFAILDTFSPTISFGARFGAGWGIGQGLVGAGGVGLIAPVV